jgi:outer membrane protein OmpA-like peptidoglycan-associated protein
MADKHDEHESHAKSGAHGHGGGGHGHGGGGHEEGHEGAPEWLISFADNVALMMGFFVILLAMNMKPVAGGEGEPGKTDAGVPTSDVIDAAIAIREAFNNPVNVNSTNPNDLPLIQRLNERRAQAEGRSRDRSVSGQEEEVQSIRPSQYFGLGGTIHFADGSSAIDATMAANVQRIVEGLRGRRTIVEVRGHVSTAEAYGKPDRGMALSLARAQAVAAELSKRGVAWVQMQVIGCADNDRATPLVYDATGQRANQRVEIVGTDRPLPDYLQMDDADKP